MIVDCGFEACPFILHGIPVACYAGSAPEQDLYLKGQNFVIRHPLAAGIEILKILQVHLTKIRYFLAPLLILSI